MRVRSRLSDLSTEALRRVLAGLPPAEGYEVTALPLRYRRGPHLAAETDFEARRIVLRLPHPFLAFGEVVRYGARRVPGTPPQRGRLSAPGDVRRRGSGGRVGARGQGLKFVWLSEGLTFRTPREVLRFLYLHEWMHWYLKKLGRKSAAETACDRFALRNYRRASVTVADADAALRRRAVSAPARARGPRG